MHANVSTLVDANLDAGRGGKIGLITTQDDRITFEALYGAMCAASEGLRGLGVRRGERVLLVLDDTLAFPAAFLGAMRIGAVPIPVSFLARDEDFGFFLDDSYAVAALVDPGFLARVGPQVHARGVPLGDVHAWIGQTADVPPVDTHPDDVAFWLYSSGSTGRPKGVVHRHASVDATCRHYAGGVLGLCEHDVVFSSTPMFHAYGLGNSVTFPLWAGATTVCLSGRPTPDRLFERVGSHHPTLLFSVPALYAAMLAHPGFDAVDWSPIRLGVSAAEPLPPEIWRQFHARTGIEILDGIGSTEMLHIYCSNRPGKVRPGTSGTPVDGYELRIDDAEGAGELLVRGPSALTGYWHQVARTRAKLRGEWFATGDRYHRDEHGFYSYEGRVDDMMKIGGLWVSPIEIENRLMEHAAVHEAAVVQVDVDNRSRIKAAVILAEGQRGGDVLAAELQAWCKAALQRHQYPHLVAFVDDLPRTATGKIQRFKLR